MKFTGDKRRQPPAVIIISLIDVLIVMLIFLMVTTTFKEHPAIKLKLPESSHAKEGATENLAIVTVSKGNPGIFLGKEALTAKQLEDRLRELVRTNPKITVAIRSDQEAPTGQFIAVMEAATAAGVKSSVEVITGKPKSP